MIPVSVENILSNNEKNMILDFNDCPEMRQMVEKETTKIVKLEDEKFFKQYLPVLFSIRISCQLRSFKLAG